MSANTYLPGTPCGPPSLLITGISQYDPMIITVSELNDYVVGQLVHLTVPWAYGMYQADRLTCEIVAVVGRDLYVDVDSTNFDPFVVPAAYQERPASLSPAGSRNIYNNTTVPFHSLTNTGN